MNKSSMYAMRTVLFTHQRNTNRCANKLIKVLVLPKRYEDTGCRPFCRQRRRQIKTRFTKGSTQFCLWNNSAGRIKEMSKYLERNEDNAPRAAWRLCTALSTHSIPSLCRFYCKKLKIDVTNRDSEPGRGAPLGEHSLTFNSSDTLEHRI